MKEYSLVSRRMCLDLLLQRAAAYRGIRAGNQTGRYAPRGLNILHPLIYKEQGREAEVMNIA